MKDLHQVAFRYLGISGFLILLLCIPSALFANGSELSPYEAEIEASHDLSSLRPRSVADARGSGRRADMAQSTLMRIRGKRVDGTVKLDTHVPQSFRTVRDHEDVTIPVGTYTGSFKSSDGEIAKVAASVYLDDTGESALKLIFTQDTKRGRKRFVSIQGNFEEGRGKFAARLKVSRLNTLPEGLCGLDGISSRLHGSAGEESLVSAPSLHTRAASRRYTVDVDVDPQYVSDTGGSSGAQATLATTFAAVNSESHEPFLDLTAEIEDIVLFNSDPFPGETDATDLINAYFAYKLGASGRASIDLLATGKDFDGSTIGIAALGAFCTSSSVGAWQRINDSTDYFVVAHEIGHVLGSDHHSSPTNIMEPALNFAPNFIQASLNQIDPVLAAGGSCLSSGGSSTPTPTSTATATATATATPTPGGGGGGSGGSGAAAPAVSLTPLFDKTLGELTLTINVDSIETGCSVRLRSGSNSGSVATSGRQASSFTPSESTSTSLSCTVSQKVRKEKGNKKKRRVFVVAESYCTDVNKTAQYSEVFTLTPGSTRSRKGSTKSASAWFSKCSKQHVSN